MSNAAFHREHGYLHARGVEDSVDRGQGVMVAAHNPLYWKRRTRFEARPTA